MSIRRTSQRLSSACSEYDTTLLERGGPNTLRWHNGVPLPLVVHPLCDSFEAYDTKQNLYSTVPSIRQPPSAHINYGKHTAEGQSIEVTRVETSFSSAASGSSDMSYPKHSVPSPEGNWPSRTLERTLADGEQRLFIQRDSASSQKAGHSQRRSEMTERTSSARVYFQDQQRIDQEEEDNDHAVWILVGNACHRIYQDC